MRGDFRDNLLPVLDDRAWGTWSPRSELAPKFIRGRSGGYDTLIVESSGAFRVYGAWRCEARGVEAGQAYEFDAACRIEGVAEPRVSIGAVLSWRDRKGAMLMREYAETTGSRDGDGLTAYRKISVAPPKACRLRVDLFLRWTPAGRVSWLAPRLFPTSLEPARRIRVATTFARPRYDRRKNLRALLDVLDRAGTSGCDIVVTSETFVDRGCFAPEPVPGDITRAVAEVAAAHRMYVVLGMNEVEGSTFYNSAVLVDRAGAIAGRYRKTHLPLVEAESGVTPGNAYPVFDTDFGVIGLLVCWDQWFPEAARRLTDGGARLLCVSTIGNAPAQAAARAVDNSVAVVVAGQDGPFPSRIIDAAGEVLGEIPGDRDDVCVREVDPGRRLVRRWFSVGDADGEVGNILRAERRLDTY